MSKEIKFGEICKGDRIRCEFAPKFGCTITYEGVTYKLHRLDPVTTWSTVEGDYLTHIERGGVHLPVKITLLDRPKPPLPTTPGTIFRATEIMGEKCDVKIMVAGTKVLTERLYFSAQQINGADIHRYRDITAWEPIEGVTA